MGGTPRKKMKRTSEADLRLNVLLEIIEVLYTTSRAFIGISNKIKAHFRRRRVRCNIYISQYLQELVPFLCLMSPSYFPYTILAEVEGYKVEDSNPPKNSATVLVI